MHSLAILLPFRAPGDGENHFEFAGDYQVIECLLLLLKILNLVLAFKLN